MKQSGIVVIVLALCSSATCAPMPAAHVSHDKRQVDAITSVVDSLLGGVGRRELGSQHEAVKEHAGPFDKHRRQLPAPKADVESRSPIPQLDAVTAVTDSLLGGVGRRELGTQREVAKRHALRVDNKNRRQLGDAAAQVEDTVEDFAGDVDAPSKSRGLGTRRAVPVRRDGQSKVENHSGEHHDTNVLSPETNVDTDEVVDTLVQNDGSFQEGLLRGPVLARKAGSGTARVKRGSVGQARKSRRQAGYRVAPADGDEGEASATSTENVKRQAGYRVAESVEGEEAGTEADEE